MAAPDDEFYSQAQEGEDVGYENKRIHIWLESRKTTTARSLQDDADSSCLGLGWKNILSL